MYFNAISLYQAGRYLRMKKVPIIPRLIQIVIYYLFNSHIPIAADIGSGTRCGHRGIAVVISKEAKIGRNCLIGPHVVIGGRGKNIPGAPVIGDNVILSAGAKILGPVKIGDNAYVGANAVVLQDVPAGATSVGVPARIIRR